jgi:hypothetical protein
MAHEVSRICFVRRNLSAAVAFPRDCEAPISARPALNPRAALSVECLTVHIVGCFGNSFAGPVQPSTGVRPASFTLKPAGYEAKSSFQTVILTNISSGRRAAALGTYAGKALKQVLGTSDNKTPGPTSPEKCSS